MLVTVQAYLSCSSLDLNQYERGSKCDENFNLEVWIRSFSARFAAAVAVPWQVTKLWLNSRRPSPAANEPTGATAEAERIIVTGSNIPTAQEVGPNPVLNINRDLINKSGERTAEELIKNLPVANGGGVPISNNATGFTPGASAISLRGLGPEATLVLIDGRRIAPYPIGNGGTSSFFDLRSIPEAAIESIEILKDGASTTYGADAIAGVVNIKLRKDYQGAEAINRVRQYDGQRFRRIPCLDHLWGGRWKYHRHRGDELLSSQFDLYQGSRLFGHASIPELELDAVKIFS